VDEESDDTAWLTLNEAKTSLKNARQERFDFLGYSFGPHRYKPNGY
jgi:RNA-directed DNA polymerase